jgi:methylenetetrahydrofolate dehydrogenase (NADP+)/methenyltetrahydrofolate cyclohydrolase
MLLLDGRAAREVRAKKLRESFGNLPQQAVLAIVQVGNLAVSNAYIKQKKIFGESLRVAVQHLRFPETVSELEIKESLQALNADSAVHGVIVQLPLPKERMDAQVVLDAVSPEKDIDGLSSVNFRKLASGASGGFVPATARGVSLLLEHYKIPIAGARVVIVGRSMLVGKPLALALLARDATVTIAHTKTKNLPEVTRAADILVVAAGRPQFITGEHVSPAQVVVDVGINDVSGQKLDEELPKRRLVGDVCFGDVKDTVAAVSPVPGGVGPMTVLALFENLYDACGKL